MTQHQAPEVTSELASCPFCGRGLQASSVQAIHPIVDGGCFLEGTGFDASEFPAWNTRATQPLSLTVDEEAVDRAARAISLVDVNYDFDALGKSTKEHYRRMARAALGEQIAENANCSGDIDRSGLAQEVE